jgi:hypothetical protein
LSFLPHIAVDPAAVAIRRPGNFLLTSMNKVGSKAAPSAKDFKNSAKTAKKK